MPTFQDRCSRGMREHGDKWDASDLLAAPEMVHYYNTNDRIEVDVYGDGVVIERGRVSTTTGWRPAFLLVHRRGDISSPTLLDGRARVLKVVSK